MKKGDSYSLALAVIFAIVFFAALATAFDASWTTFGITTKGQEDTLFVYNFTANVSSAAWNEGLTFSIANVNAINYTKNFMGSGSTLAGYPWMSLNSSTGILTINSTFDNESAFYNISVTVLNSTNYGETAPFYFNITPVNDPPRFTDLTNQTFISNGLFSQLFHAYDEENNTPFKLNITFLSCNTAAWSPRNSTNCTLFSNSSYTFDNSSGLLNITFTPDHNDTGSYVINFTLTDSGSIWPPFNASLSQLVNFTVLNSNQPPYFTYTCNNERNATEGSAFSCYINATDPDEVHNLTFQSSVNGSSGNWFTFASTGTNSSYVNASVINFSTVFNGTLISFTPTDAQVGNWTVSINVTDTGSPVLSALAVFNFSVANVEESPVMQDPGNQTVYTSNNYTFYVNATDNDLLIPDKSVYNEILTFSSNDSRVFVKNPGNTLGNKTTAQVTLNGSDFTAGMNYVKITVTDASGSQSSGILNLSVSNNHAPQWVSGLQNNFTLNENTPFYLNLTANATDADGNQLNFSFANQSYFPDFGIALTTGIINFTPTDGDVGSQVVTVNVTDGIAQVSQLFNFTIYNVNDTPIIQKPVTVVNAYVNGTSSNVIAQEDNATQISLYVRDDDLLIQQKSFYNESLNISYINVTGPNPNLISFLPDSIIRNLSIFTASFTPRKADVGTYQIRVNVTDASGLNDSLQFNMTVNAINHVPTISAVPNLTSTILAPNNTLYYDLNGSDIEDGNDSTGNLTYRYAFLSGTDFITNNETLFNKTSGIFNITFNSSQGGSYHFNATIMDSTGLNGSRDFWIFVYDVPNITSPAAGTTFNMAENNVTNLNFSAAHTVGDNLSYMFYISGLLRYQTNGSGSGGNISWAAQPNFTDETYGGLTNITLFVQNLIYPGLNASLNWSTNISHANAPVLFNGNIGDKQATTNQNIEINLSQYFSDSDHNDPYYNYAVNFTVYSNATTNSTNSSVTATIDNSSWMLTLSAPSALLEMFNVSGTDGQYTNISNNFLIQFTVPPVTPVSGGSGGGGGGSSVRPVSLNIIVPGPLTARKQDKLIVPISIVNTGTIALNGIVLRNTIAKNGLLREDLLASFDKSTIDSLYPGQRENLTLIVDVNTKDLGLYEVTLNATSASPPYTDTAKLYVNVQEGDTVAQRIQFTDQLIADNPQCIEIQEMVNQAQKLFDAGNSDAASAQIEQAIQACQNAIAQSVGAQQRPTVYQQAMNVAGIAAVASLILGVGYYWYRRARLQKALLAEVQA